MAKYERDLNAVRGESNWSRIWFQVLAADSLWNQYERSYRLRVTIAKFGFQAPDPRAQWYHFLMRFLLVAPTRCEQAYRTSLVQGVYYNSY